MITIFEVTVTLKDVEVGENGVGCCINKKNVYTVQKTTRAEFERVGLMRRITEAINEEMSK